jgi:hypothetical protein
VSPCVEVKRPAVEATDHSIIFKVALCAELDVPVRALIMERVTSPLSLSDQHRVIAFRQLNLIAIKPIVTELTERPKLKPTHLHSALFVRLLRLTELHKGCL